MLVRFGGIVAVCCTLWSSIASAQSTNVSACDANGFINWVGGKGLLDASPERFAVVASFGTETKCTYDYRVPTCVQETNNKLVSAIQMDLVEAQCGQSLLAAVQQDEWQSALAGSMGLTKFPYRVQSGLIYSTFSNSGEDVEKLKARIQIVKRFCLLNDLSDASFLNEVQKSCSVVEERRRAAVERQDARQKNLGLQGLTPDKPATSAPSRPATTTFQENSSAVDHADSDSAALKIALENASCEELWYKRNSIFKSAGYCFASKKAIDQFGNIGCRFDNMDDVPLEQGNLSYIDAIKSMEKDKRCPGRQ